MVRLTISIFMITGALQHHIQVFNVYPSRFEFTILNPCSDYYILSVGYNIEQVTVGGVRVLSVVINSLTCDVIIIVMMMIRGTHGRAI